MNATSASLPSGESEVEVAKLSMAPCNLVKVPRVANSPIALECRYLKTVELPCTLQEGGNVMVIGEVVGIHIDDSVITDDGLVDVRRIKPLARLGYHEYTWVDKTMEMERPG